MSSRDRAKVRALWLQSPEAIAQHYKDKGREVPKWVEQTIRRQNKLQPPIRDLQMLIANLQKFEEFGYGLVAKYGSTAQTLLQASIAADGDTPELMKYQSLIWQKFLKLMAEVDEDIEAMSQLKQTDMRLEFDYITDLQLGDTPKP